MKNITTSIFFLLLIWSCTDFTTDREILEELKLDIAYLADDALEGRAIGTEGEEKAANYLAERFKEIGLKPGGTEDYYQIFTVNKPASPHEQAEPKADGEGITGRNVIGMIDNKSSKYIVIGAHYDHLGYGGEGSLYRGEPAIHNGADDNASGTAALLQLAKILQVKKSAYNFVFVAFSGEENGLWGSNYYTKNTSLILDSINFMINMDMVGRLNEENTLAVNGVGTSPVWEETLAEANTDSLKLVTSASGVGPSDHTSFYLQDMPVLHFFTGQHDDYHRPSDDADKINYEGMVKVIRLIERVIDQLDEDEAITFTKTQDSNEDTPRFSVSMGVVPDYLFDGKGMRIDGVTEGKPAQKAGLKKGDIVIKLGDSTVVDMMSYMRALSSFNTGDQTVVEFKRGAEVKASEVKF